MPGPASTWVWSTVMPWARRDTQTPHARVTAHPEVKALPKRRLAKQYSSFNPAAVQRQIQALCDEPLTLATAKGQPAHKPHVTTPATRTFPDEATKQHLSLIHISEPTRRTPISY